MNIRNYIIPISQETEKRQTLANFEKAIKPTINDLLAKGCKIAMIKTKLKETQHTLCRLPDESDQNRYKKHINHQDKIVPIEVAFASFIEELEFGNPEVIWMRG